MPGQGFTHEELPKQPLSHDQTKRILDIATEILTLQMELNRILEITPENTFNEETWKIINKQASYNGAARYHIQSALHKNQFDTAPITTGPKSEDRTMNQKEHMLAEAVKSMFNNDPKTLGIVKGKPITDPTSRMPHQYEYIMDLFALKIADSTFFESIKSAFYDIHSYKFINDPSFCDSFIRRMKAIGLPHEEINKACVAVEGICEELGASDWFRGDRNWDEKSAGWHKDLAGIKQVSQDFNQKPKREEPYSGGGPAPKMIT